MKRVFLFLLLVVPLAIFVMFASRRSLFQGLFLRNSNNSSSYSSGSLGAPNDQANRALNQAFDMQIKYDIQTLENALVKHHRERNEYPTNLDLLLQLDYVPEVPINPITKSDYQYVTNGQSFSLTAVTSDGSSVNISR